MSISIQKTIDKLQAELESLSELVRQLDHLKESERKKQVLKKHVSHRLGAFPHLAAVLDGLALNEQIIVYSLIAIGQGHLLFPPMEEGVFLEKLHHLIADLEPAEQFYEDIGGIVGYHLVMLKLLVENVMKRGRNGRHFHQAPYVEIFEDNVTVRKVIFEGIKALDKIGTIFPVGGSGDRLNLHDPHTHVCLPAAKLEFCGKTLLTLMIEDVAAEEYLFYKLFDRQITILIALMTSHEKENHRHILEICEQNRYFQRRKESFRFFCQPLVPTIDEEGNWCLHDEMKPLLKPGGHGVIWKLAQEQGVFDWFKQHKRNSLLIRQVNNPIAGVDYGLLAFLGYGVFHHKAFGFASCPRKVESNEGMDVLIETVTEKGHDYCLTNIEYCDFQKYHIKDEPEVAGGEHSKFTSNTNILFADLDTIEQITKKMPIPGMLLNFKNISCFQHQGNHREKKVARLESTMQNIADYIVDHFEEEASQEDLKKLKTFLTYNLRNKTISTAKREFLHNLPLLETPEGCFQDVLKNSRDVLQNHCGMSVPDLRSDHDYLVYGPSFVFLYHPSLGPLYSIIGQKIRGGKIGYRGELLLEIAEVDIRNLDLEGCLHIKADGIMGDLNDEGVLTYSKNNGKCTLINVTVKNEGINHTLENQYWKNQVQRNAVCEIILHGNGEFYAENVTLSSGQFEVPAGHKVTVTQEGVRLEKISSPTWYWDYRFDKDYTLTLHKVAL